MKKSVFLSARKLLTQFPSHNGGVAPLSKPPKSGVAAFLLLLFLLTFLVACGSSNESESNIEQITHEPQVIDTVNEPIPTATPEPEPILPVAPERGVGTLMESINHAIQNEWIYQDSESEFNRQLELLYQFASNLNAGGVTLNDLVITRVWGDNVEGIPINDPFTWDVLYTVNFYVSFLNNLPSPQILDELLEFTGIVPDNIHFSASPSIIPFNFYDFLLVNQAMYEYARPHFLLKEYARELNSGTLTRDDVIITMFNDFGLFHDLSSPEFWFDERFLLGVMSTDIKDEPNFINDILSLTGLTIDDIEFMQQDVGNQYVEFQFLQVNEELGQLYEQWNLLRDFQNLAKVRSSRRGIIMEHVITFISPADVSGGAVTIGGDVWNMGNFQVGFGQNSYSASDEIAEILVAFTGIPYENIDFMVGATATDAGWTPFGLTPEQIDFIRLLDIYMETVNAPFWEDRHTFDPVIVRIDNPEPLPWFGEPTYVFTIWVYNEDLIDYITEDVMAFTGMTLNDFEILVA